MEYATPIIYKDPKEMTSAERFNEIASILAAGYLRYKASQIQSKILKLSDKALDYSCYQSTYREKG
ncbi:MAG: hypothetical protein HQK79_22460 [Desulfobacterales bacterium]|nr:hypothetical protein [Desulfobacterales bacterium]